MSTQSKLKASRQTIKKEMKPENHLSKIEKTKVSNNFEQESYSNARIVEVNIEDLEPNINNIRKIDPKSDEMQELITSIEAIGLQQSLVVCRNAASEKKKYRILTGHRRFCAIKSLHEKYPDNINYSYVPCQIVENMENAYGIDGEIYEKFMIASTNMEFSQLNPGEQLKCIEYYEAFFNALRKTDPEKMKGKRTLLEVSKAIGISNGKINYLKRINKELVEVLKKEYLEGRLKPIPAMLLAELSESKQNLFIKQNVIDYEKLTKEDVETFKACLEEKKGSEEKERMKINEPIDQTFSSLVRKLNAMDVSEIEEISKTDYEKYQKAIKKIQSGMKTLRKLMEK